MVESDKSEKERRIGGDYCVAGSPNGQSCQNTKRKGFKLHKFPKNPIGRTKWVKFVQKHRPDFKDLTSKYTSLCSAHFEDDCYEHNKLVVDAVGQSSGLEIKSYIKRDAAPTRDTIFAASPVLSKRAKRQVSKNICL